jgi:hypothetical protein
VGLSLAINAISTDTAAYVGDNHNDVAVSIDPSASGSGAQGKVKADTLSIDATTYGVTAALAIAAEDVGDKDRPDNTVPPNTPVKALQLLGIASNKGGANVGIAGSSAVEINSLTTSAYLSYASVDRLTAGGSNQTTIAANNNVLLLSVSGGGALDAAQNGGNNASFTAAIAGSVAVGISGNSTTAYVDHSSLSNAKSVTVDALAGGLDVVVGLGVSINRNANTSDAASAAGSVSVAQITDHASAYADGSSISGVVGGSGGNLGDVNFAAYRSTEIGIGAGSLYYGGKGGIGLALTYSQVGDPSGGFATDAHISNTNVTNYADVNVLASDPSRIYSGAAMVGLATANGLGGSIVVADIGDTTTAYIQGSIASSLTVAASGSVTVAANDTRNSTFESALGTPGQSPSQPGTAGTVPNVDFQAVAVQNVTDPGQSVIGPGAAIISVAGLVQVGSGGAASVGVGVIDDYVHQTHSAQISEAKINASGAPIAVTATDGTSILSIGVGIGVQNGGSFAGQAAITDNRIDSTVIAQVGDANATTSNTTVTAGNLVITAQDGSVIRSGALVVTYANNAGGLTVVSDSIGDTISSGVMGAKVSTDASTQISALSDADVLTVSVGIAISKSVGIAGSVAKNVMNTNVSAFITGGADVSANGSVLVRGANTDHVGVIAGALGFGLNTLGVGISVVTNAVGGDTLAYIDQSSVVDAHALAGSAAALAIDSGNLANPFDVTSALAPTVTGPDMSETQSSVAGLAVVATSHQTVLTNAVTLGLSFNEASVGVAVSPVINTMSGATKATIDSAQIDTRLSGTAGAAGPQIDVIASSQSFSGNFVIAGATGGGAGAGAAATNTMDRATQASITNSTVGTAPAIGTTPTPLGDITVSGTSSQLASNVVVGFAAGFGSGAGSVVVNLFSADTRAFVDQSTVTARSLNVAADSANGYFASAGAGGGNIGGVAGAVLVGVSNNTTLAYVGDVNSATTLNLNGGLTIAASSENNFYTYAIGGEGAGAFGIAGMADVTIISNTTVAGLYDTNVTQPQSATQADKDGNGNPVTNPAGLKVVATETVNAVPKTGGGAGGGVGGVGAAANVVLLSSTLTAEAVGDQISSPGALIVSAGSNKYVNAQTYTFGVGGVGGIGAAVGVVLLGSSVPGGVMGDLDANGSGTLTTANTISTGGGSFLLGAAGLTTFRSAAATIANPNPTDAQVQAYALTQYQNLTNNGSVDRNGVLTLNSAGLSLFRAAAAASLGRTSATDAQAQTYANNLYHQLVAGDVKYVLGPSGVGQFAQAALSSNDFATFQQLVNDGTGQGTAYALSTSGLADFRPVAAAALGVASPSDAQVQAYAAAQYLRLAQATQVYADTRYGNLLAAGTVTAGKLTLASASIPTYVQQALSSTDYAAYQQLVGSGSVQNGVFILNGSALATYRPLAAAALSIANPTDQQVQSYANGLYTGYVQQTQTYADQQYQLLATNGATVAPAYSVTAALGGSNDAVTAQVAGGTLTVGSVNATATAQVRTNNYTTGVGVGGGGGVGAAIGFTRVYDTVIAAVNPALLTTSSVSVSATMADQGGSAGQVQAYAGAGGLLGAAGAAVADTALNNTVTAALGGTIVAPTTGTAPNVTVQADDGSTARGDAFGITAGLVALGISLANVAKTSSVNASVLPNAQITGNGVSLTAAAEGATYALTVAGVGGLEAAGAGSQTTASDTSHVTAELGAARVNVGTGTVSVTAIDTPDAKAMSLGVAVSAAGAVGVSIANATVSPIVTAQVDSGANITAGALNVVATSTFGGAAPGTVPTNAFLVSTNLLPGSTGDFAAGGTAAAAWAVAGSGSLYLAADGTVTSASNNANVTAQIGDSVALPNGNVTISATNLTNQVSYSTGIAAAGLLSIGDVKANSSSDTVTLAQTGSGITSGLGRTGDLTIAATGYDYNSAKAVAGGGGLLSGSGAEASTSSTSNLTASLGDNALFVGGAVMINAVHLTGFKSTVDSTNAAAIGGSASIANNTINANTTASLGNNDGIVLSGGLTVTAQSQFNQTGSDDSAKAAAGGGLNGTGATSATNITGNANINLGSGVVVMTGTDGITMLASTVLMTNDTVSLQTGGVLEGSGASSTLNANVTTAVTIADALAGNPNQLISQGNINIGTDTQVSAATMALVNTWGLATVGHAGANTNVTSNQTITLGSNTSVLGIGTVNVTAGFDPTALQLTSINAVADAEGYVYGLIAIPGANASAPVTSNVAVVQGTGSSVASATDITIGAYNGTTVQAPHASGHGYELGFIPVSVDGTGSVTPTTSSTVTINGTVTAGIYHDQEITIGCGAAICGVNDPAQLTLTSGAPLIVNGVMLSAGAPAVAAQGFDPTAFVTAKFDPEVAPIMLNGVSSGQVPAFMIGQLYAAGGNVTINADTVHGSGTVTAYGGPKINVVNTTSAYVVVQSAYIPDAPGGQVLFSGTAQRGDVGAVTLNEAVDPAGPIIKVDMSYAGPSLPGSTAGPAFFNTGNITNLGGPVVLTNATGWFGQLGTVLAANVSETAPSGGLIVSALNPGQMYNAGSFPYSDWVEFMTFPGSPTGGPPALTDPVSQANAAQTVVSYIANLFAAHTLPQRIDPSQIPSFYDTSSQNLLNLTLYGVGGNAIPQYVPIIGFSFPSTPLSRDNNSWVFFGNCAFSAYGACGAGTANSKSPVGTNYVMTPFSSEQDDGHSEYQPVVPYIVAGGLNGAQTSTASNNFLNAATSYSYANLPSTPKVNSYGTPGLVQAVGGPVAIKADIINVNGTIQAGIPNSWSVALPQSLVAPATTQQVLSGFHFGFNPSTFQFTVTPVYQTIVTGGGAIAQYELKYQLGQQSLTSGVHNYSQYESLTPNYVVPTLSTVGLGDQLITTTYNAASNTLSLSNVNASSGGGFVLLDGKIINTSPQSQGNINVNGGLGQVTVDNQTGLAVTVNSLNTGSTTNGQPLVSRVKIVDRLRPDAGNTTTYLFTPGQGVSSYQTGFGNDPILSGPNATPLLSSTSGSSGQFVPVSGARFEWIQQAELTRDISFSNGVTNDGNWQFSNIQSDGNPWHFLNANNQPVSDLNAQGRVVVGSSNPYAFQETMTASINNYFTVNHGYGCSSGCNYGFIQLDPNDQFARWFYNFPTDVTLTLTSSVKADNPFGINFAGNANALINITSNAPVTFGGTVTNPSGTTTVAVTNGGIAQAPNGIFTTGNLSLSASGAVGSAAQRFNALLSPGAIAKVQGGAGGVYLNFGASTALIDKVSAGSQAGGYGDVSIAAIGGILRAPTHVDGSAMGSSDVNLVGNNIALTSTLNGVGTGTNPLVVSANSTTLGNGTVTGGVITVNALKDVGLTQASGDMRVGAIATLGDVYLNVLSGNLVDAGGKTSAGALSDNQVAAIVSKLHLTDGANQGIGAQEFENLLNRDYGQYFSLIGRGNVSQGASIDTAALSSVLDLYRPLAEAAQIANARTLGVAFQGSALTPLTDAQVLQFAGNLVSRNGTLTLNSAGLAFYRPQAAAALQQATLTDAQVQAYANAQYQTYASVFAQGVGASWASQAQFRQKDPSYQFRVQAGSTLATSLALGSTWTANQLISEVNASPTAVGNTAASIAARNVTLNATGGGVGLLSTPVFIGLQDLQQGSLLAGQRRALAGATPGSVTAVGSDGRQYAPGSVPNGVQILGVDVGQTAPVFLSMSGTVQANASGNVFLQGSALPNAAGDTLRIAHIVSGGDVSLVTPMSIVAAAGAAPTQIQATGNLTLITDQSNPGSLGSSALPLTYQIGGKLVTATAGQDIYLDPVGGDATIGVVSGKGSVSITNLDGGIFGYIPGLAVTGNTVSLVALGDIGTSLQPLTVKVGASGTLSGSTQRSAYLFGPTLPTDTAPTNFTIADFSAGGGITIGADGVLAIAAGSRLAATGGAVTLDAGSLIMGAGGRISAGQLIAVTTIGDAVLGQLGSTQSPQASGAAPVITVTAGTAQVVGAIVSNGDGQANILATAPNANASLTAQGGIGTLLVDTPSIAASSATGDIRLTGVSTLHATSIAAGAGGAALESPGAVTIDQAIVATGLTLGGTGISANITQAPAGTQPLFLTIGGYHGGNATTANLDVTAPLGLNMGFYGVVDSTLTTTAANVSISTGNVPGQLTLTTPQEHILLNDRSSAPINGPDIQLYAATSTFYLYLQGKELQTNALVVQAAPGSSIANNPLGGAGWDVANFVGQTFQQGGHGPGLPSIWDPGSHWGTYVLGLSPTLYLDSLQLPPPVEKMGNGPAVKTDDKDIGGSH